MAQSPAGSPGGSPGRPSLWTPSAERKLIRLYVYTTLSLDTINKLVHYRQPEAGPGTTYIDTLFSIDSANRKLRSLLDKEPRWLHPRDESDMGRRLNELSNSPTRLTAADCSSSDSSGSFLSPYDTSSPMSIRSEHLNAPHQAWTRRSASPSNANDGAAFIPFLRQTTYLSTSTDGTTGSYRQILHDHSEQYVLAVKRLVKRFTAPFVARVGLHSSTPEMMATSTWDLFCDPYPLPRHLLYRDIFILGGDHDLVSPWIAASGITSVGQHVCVFGPTQSEFLARDSVGNTVLHFIAAHGTLELLLRILRSGLADAVARERNTGGQYFLHVINNESMQDVHRLQQLLLLASARGVDVDARDVYGRTVFHMVRLSGHGPDTVGRLASPFHGPGSNRRDAFGLVPTVASVSTEPEPAAEEPDINAHRRRLGIISLALQNPSVEDDRGRNGLHCLVAGALSVASVARRCDMDMCPNIPTNLDSASETFRLRHELARGLLEAGVDPNHYDLAGNTPLMTFAAELPEDDDYRRGPAMMELLIQHGADVKARNRAGETALHVAVRKGRKLAVRVLVHNGASVHVHDAQGRSLLDVADAMTQQAYGSGKDYAHFEACRAWLSGDAGKAVQRPSLMDEWSLAQP
ncbi:hypothetical protein CP533_2496 [Ophiocordyceps camponoti-saundersi (nom. inval.)]|nr:hypothetical protein CP533_2496 [Ophiocordyceps camponoti-saundersi (nom. inval.)]